MYEKSANVVIAWQSKQNTNPRTIMKRLGSGSLRVRKLSPSIVGSSYGCAGEASLVSVIFLHRGMRQFSVV
jgi:hypothetical protein